ncbi:MAG: biotin carboxylase N-terminal domain-containing protein [Pseudomonadota bacterium]
MRVIRTARRMGVETVAVFSEADRGAMHVRHADHAVLLGPADAKLSYLDGNRVIQAARDTQADAIHPGYGFLSENAKFAADCAHEGLIFVGPPAAAIEAMGSKSEAKAVMERAGVPIVPGYHGEMQDPAFLKRKAYEIGYPVLIKAVLGGGGKGMRRVDRVLDFDEALAAARREAAAAFGDGRVLVEKFIQQPRHIEIQVFADGKGSAVSLHERDCSVQRRHQKVMEEAPAPGMTPQLRAAMGKAATRAAQAVGYVGAGTVEFIVSGGALDENAFYFMEMNTRLQVEHPVTELVSGFDLVEWQLRVAAGEALPAGEPRPPRGHAVEVRLYAEDPDNNFLPSAGRIAALEFGEGVRVDAGVEPGDEVSPHYDPMIAKLIAHGDDRDTAFEKLRTALSQTVAIGPRTNLPFLSAIVTHPEVLSGQHDTGFVDRHLAELTGGSVSNAAVADAAAALIIPVHSQRSARAGGYDDPFDAQDGFRLSGDGGFDVPIMVDGDFQLARLGAGAQGLSVALGGVVAEPGRTKLIEADGDVFAIEAGRAVRVSLVDQLSRSADDDMDTGAHAPMHGRIVEIYAQVGVPFAAGDKLYAIEAMKMEHVVRASRPGVVRDVLAQAGAQVAEGAEVVALDHDTAGEKTASEKTTSEKTAD